MAGKHKTLTFTEKQFIADNYSKLSVKEIAKEINRPVSTVTTYARRHDLHKRTNKLKDYEQGIRELHSLGLTRAEIATRLLLPKATVDHWFKHRLTDLVPIYRRGETPPERIRQKYCEGRKKREKRKRKETRMFKVQEVKASPHAKKAGAQRHVNTYTDHEEEFLRAILAFRDTNKRIPSLVEGFRIALSLGWRKEEKNGIG